MAQILGRFAGGGVEAVVCNYYKAMDKSRVQFDFFIEEHSPHSFPDEFLRQGAGLFRVPAYTRFHAYIKTLYRIFKEKKYTIVHAHLNTVNAFPLLAAFLAGVPVRICHNHSTAEKGEKLRTAMKYAFRPFAKLFASHYFSCGKHAGEWMYGKRAMEKGRVVVVPNAIDLPRFRYQEQARQTLRKELDLENCHVLGHIGRFMYQKNHPFLVTLFAELQKECPQARLLLLGEGETKKEVEQQVQALGVQDKVVFVGFSQNPERYLSAMDVFCLPSHYEGLGMVAIEAQVCGLPVVASSQVPREADITGKICFLPLEDQKAWMNALQPNIQNATRLIEPGERMQGYDIVYQANCLAGCYIRLQREELKEQTAYGVPN